ncbi:MAG TPA: 2-keto-4-methylthiobutyrate aminotransferase [Firmicutes bacterium]|nr:2-keto-4-methylthiobutyrate aminotransferase [Bacillota bacterium]
MSGMAWVNGRFVDPLKPSLGVQERGFIFGDGLFETIRLREGQPLYWQEHLARLRNGCSVLNINFPLTEIRTGVWETSARIKNGVLRLTVTRGAFPGRGLLPPQNGKPTVAITGYPGEPYPEQSYKKVFRACLISFPRSHLSPLVKLKSLNFLENLLGKMEAAAAGADEGIFCNYQGEIAEGTTSNIFVVIKGELVTPPPECGLLPGIMRAQVLSLAERLGVNAAQGKICPQDFCRAEEAFLTSSLLEVMPLVSVNGNPIGRGSPGPVTEMLRQELKNI